MRERRLRSALAKGSPLALAAALVVSACIVPGLDGEFKVDPSAAAGGGSSASSSGGGSSTSSSSGDGSSSSSSSSSSSGTSGTTLDAGADAGPQSFCAAQKRDTLKFCSDFTTGDAPLFDGWTTETRKVNGTITAEGTGVDRRIVAAVNAAGGPNFPGVGIAAVIAGGVPVGKTLTMRLEFEVGATSNAYADVGLVQVGPPLAPNTQRGFAVNRCRANGTKMCLQENDGTGGASGEELELTANATYVGVITVTHSGVNQWTSKVEVEAPTRTVLATRTGNAYTDFDGSVRVLVGAENAGDFGTSTTFRIDDVAVDVK